MAKEKEELIKRLMLANKQIAITLDDISANVKKIIDGTAKKETFYALIKNVMRYNIYSNLPEEARRRKDLPEMPRLVNEEKYYNNDAIFENQRTTRGFYSTGKGKTGNTMTINEAYYNLESLKDPQTLVDFFDTVSHETRHWFQDNVSYSDTIEGKEQQLLNDQDAEGFKDEGIYKRAQDEYTRPTLSQEDCGALLENFTDDELASLADNLGQDVIADYEKIRNGREYTPYNILTFAMSWGSYTNVAYEADARSSGAAGAANILFALCNSKNATVKNFANNAAVEVGLKPNINGEYEKNFFSDYSSEEMENIEFGEGLENIIRSLTPKHLYKMLTSPGFEHDSSLYSKFRDLFLNGQSQEVLKQLSLTAYCEGRDSVVSNLLYSEIQTERKDIVSWLTPSQTQDKEVYTHIDKTTLKDDLNKILSTGSMVGLDGEEMRVTPKGYWTILASGEFDSQTLAAAANRLLEEKDYKSLSLVANMLSTAKPKEERRYGTLTKTRAEAQKEPSAIFVENFIDKIDVVCEDVKANRVSEMDVLKVLKTNPRMNKYVNNVIDAKQEYLKEVRGNMENLTAPDLDSKLKTMIDETYKQCTSLNEAGQFLAGLGSFAQEEISDKINGLLNEYASTVDGLIGDMQKLLGDDTSLAQDSKNSLQEKVEKEKKMIQKLKSVYIKDLGEEQKEEQEKEQEEQSTEQEGCMANE